MSEEETGKVWRGVSEEIIVGMTEWRQQNPKSHLSGHRRRIGSTVSGTASTDVSRSSREQRQCRMGGRGRMGQCVRIVERQLQAKGKKAAQNCIREGGERSS